ncbi:hypothetical protein MKX83_24145 [Cytobacillus sp. FSL M8-0252]|uniref:hypothetical protein n=1 Tax=Cytobacillus sp. FSL M8-0252 TaxID=2921621 RepID=UPI0030F55118
MIQNKIRFTDEGIQIVLVHSKKTGFTFYEDEAKEDNECLIKPIETKNRIEAFKNKDKSLFLELYRREQGIPLYDEQNNLKNILV